MLLFVLFKRAINDSLIIIIIIALSSSQVAICQLDTVNQIDWFIEQIVQLWAYNSGVYGFCDLSQVEYNITTQRLEFCMWYDSFLFYSWCCLCCQMMVSIHEYMGSR